MVLSEKSKVAIKIIALVLIALVSFVWVADYAASPQTHEKTIETLDNKKTTVLALVAATTTASVIVSSIPGDAATPIANELADLSGKFLLVVAALYLEKYLITIAGYGTFSIIVPTACLLLILYVLQKDDKFKNLSIKLIALGVVLFLAVPSGVKIAGIIDSTYEDSISAAIDAANDTADKVDNKEDKSLWENLVSGIANGVTESVNYIKNILNNFIEALAVLIVTSCVIPLVVLAFLVWFINFIFGININLPKMPKKGAIAKQVTKALSNTDE